MRTLVVLLSIILLNFSCEFKDVNFEGVEGFKMNNINTKNANFNVQIKVKNENGFALKVKKANLKIILDGKQMGTLRLDNKVKIKRKRSGVYDLKLDFEFAEGAMMNAMSLMGKPQVDLTFDGKVKGGVLFISKKIDVKRTQSFDPSIIKENMRL